MAQLPECLAVDCGRRVEEAGDRYCSDCRCSWCGGDASQGNETSQGWRFCSSSCEKHFFNSRADEALD